MISYADTQYMNTTLYYSHVFRRDTRKRASYVGKRIEIRLENTTGSEELHDQSLDDLERRFNDDAP